MSIYIYVYTYIYIYINNYKYMPRGCESLIGGHHLSQGSQESRESQESQECQERLRTLYVFAT